MPILLLLFQKMQPVLPEKLKAGLIRYSPHPLLSLSTKRPALQKERPSGARPGLNPLLSLWMGTPKLWLWLQRTLSAWQKEPSIRQSSPAMPASSLLDRTEGKPLCRL